MVPEAKIRELVTAHSRLEDPMTCAIWIRRERSEAWLVEVIPSMADDDRAHDPTYFNPGAGFRFPLALIAGNRASIEAAIRRDAELARDVANGVVVHDGVDAHAIVDLARQTVAAAQP